MQTEYLREFLQYRDKISTRILQNEGLDPFQLCSDCHAHPAKWRCLTCSSNVFCRSCCRQRHALDLFHNIERWTGQYFQTSCLWEVGARLYMGHNGKPCPTATMQCDAINQQENALDQQDRLIGPSDSENLGFGATVNLTNVILLF